MRVCDICTHACAGAPLACEAQAGGRTVFQADWRQMLHVCLRLSDASAVLVATASAFHRATRVTTTSVCAAVSTGSNGAVCVCTRKTHTRERTHVRARAGGERAIRQVGGWIGGGEYDVHGSVIGREIRGHIYRALPKLFVQEAIIGLFIFFAVLLHRHGGRASPAPRPRLGLRPHGSQVPVPVRLPRRGRESRQLLLRGVYALRQHWRACCRRPTGRLALGEI